MASFPHLRAGLAWLSLLAAAPAQELVAEQEPASAADIEAVMAAFDEHVTRGDVAGYLARFEPENPGAVAVHGRHLERLVAASKRRTCATHVHNGPYQIGPRTVVRLRHELELEAADGTTRELVEDTYLALRRDGDRVVPTFAAEIPPDMNCVWTRTYQCPACNYELGGVEGWLCVPIRKEKALSLESASFFLMGSDVICELHVQVQGAPTAAADAARKLADAFAEVEPTAVVGPVRAWTPERYRAAPLEGMDSAQVDVQLPSDTAGRGGRRATFHVVTFGGLQHVLMLRGSEDALRAGRARVAGLLNSYGLVEGSREIVEAAKKAVGHHVGGSFEGARYQNQRYGVTFSGPDGWRPQNRVGGSRFRVRWTGPDGSQVWLVAYSVPTGIDAWTRETADRWVDWHCKKFALAPASDQPEALTNSWHESADGAAQRSSLLLCNRPKTPTTPKRRVLHVQVHEDLLLIVDGFGRDAQAERAILAALPSLRRAR